MIELLNSIENIKEVFSRKNYLFFDANKPFNLNLFGIRSANKIPNKFDDLIVIAYRNNDLEWQIDSYKATTDPGLYWLRNPMNVKGTAILVEDQYRNVFMLGLHKGFPALIQKASMKVYRDRNQDDSFDFYEKNIDEGFFAINMHGASKNNISINVDKWSAGCQVIADPKKYRDEFIPTCIKQNLKYGNSFTYTLFNEQDFKEL